MNSVEVEVTWGWHYCEEVFHNNKSCIASPYDNVFDSVTSSMLNYLKIAMGFINNSVAYLLGILWQCVAFSYNCLQNSSAYLYGLVPILSQSRFTHSIPHLTSPPTTLTSMDSQQLTLLVEKTVRETLKRDSAILLEDTVNHPRFKALIEKILAEKIDSWDPSVLSSDHWKLAIKDIVEEHYTNSYQQINLEENIRNIEMKVELNANELAKLQESYNVIYNKILVLERDMHSIVEQFVTRQHLEEVIKNLTVLHQNQFKIDEDHINEKVLADVTGKVKEDVRDLFKTLQDNKEQVEITNESINIDQMKAFVTASIERALTLYDADKTGLVDYALESSGGNIISTRCTESYSAGHGTYLLLGFALWHRSNSPRTVIQPGVHPGECWSFAGGQGYIVLQLSANIIVSAFTIEHIPRSLAPQGRIDSAPKDFSVWGLKFEADSEPAFLGRYRFMENGTSLQKFDALSVQEPFRLVELKIESNHGNLEYTCLYRFRVHGVPVS